LGAYIQYYQERMGAPRSFTVLGGVDAVMLMTATGLCFLFAFRRKIALHRQWATRSYALALVFIAGRFVMGVTGWETLGVEIVQAIIWSCLALALVFADISIHWRELKSAFSKPVKAPVATNRRYPSASHEPRNNKQPQKGAKKHKGIFSFVLFVPFCGYNRDCTERSNNAETNTRQQRPRSVSTRAWLHGNEHLLWSHPGQTGNDLGASRSGRSRHNILRHG
jgi:hypothetical protein